MNTDNDLNKLMHLCFLLMNSETGKDIKNGFEWKSDAQVLGVKLFRHIASAQQISEGISIDLGYSRHLEHVNHSSVAIVIRAAIEAYLAFNYIFTNENLNLSVYRHKLWRLGGLIDRSKIFTSTPESQKQLALEAISIKKLKEEIGSDPFFLECNRDARKEILKGNWKPKGGWNALGSHADIHEVYFNNIYNHLSGHSHASYISALQIRDAIAVETQRLLATSSHQIGCLILAHFIFSYVKLFPRAQQVLDDDLELFNVAAKWHIQKKDVKFIYEKINPEA